VEKQFENKAGKLWLREDGILQLQANEGIEISRQNAIEFLSKARSWTEKKIPLLVDRSNRYSTSFAIIDETDEIIKTISGIAYVVNSSVAEKASELAKDLFFEEIPVKIFFSIEAAVNWLKGFLD